MRTILLLLLASLAVRAIAQPARRPTPAARPRAPRVPPPAAADPQQEPTRRYLWRLWQWEQERLDLCTNAAARVLFPLLEADPPRTEQEEQRRVAFVDRQTRQAIRELSIFLQKVDRETAWVPARCRTLHNAFRYFVWVDLSEAQRAVALARTGRAWEIKRLDRPNPAKLARDEANRILGEVFRLQGVPQTFTFGEEGYGK